MGNAASLSAIWELGSRKLEVRKQSMATRFNFRVRISDFIQLNELENSISEYGSTLHENYCFPIRYSDRNQ